MKGFSLRATTRSERFELIFYPLCIVLLLAMRLSPHHHGNGWTFLFTPLSFFALAILKVRQRQLGPVEWPISLHLSTALPDVDPASRKS